jgi:hypothetical protein
MVMAKDLCEYVVKSYKQLQRDKNLWLSVLHCYKQTRHVEDNPPISSNSFLEQLLALWTKYISQLMSVNLFAGVGSK